MMSIKKVIKRLVEAEVTKRYPMPPEIKDALENKLKMNPIPRFVNNLKAVNSIPASYRIFLHNNQFFDIIYEEFSLMVKIGTKEYFLGNIDEKNYAIKHINRLMTEPKLKMGDDEEEDLDLPPSPEELPSPPEETT